VETQPHPFHAALHPASASWLNLVERWFGELTHQEELQRGTHRSVRELNIRSWIQTWNDDTRVWCRAVSDKLAIVAMSRREESPTTARSTP
jgi:hypothetical protein